MAKDGEKNGEEPEEKHLKEVDREIEIKEEGGIKKEIKEKRECCETDELMENEEGGEGFGKMRRK